ncbi:MAG: lysine transporter LysE [Ponticaulis sp.]|nr:lysine transporter LysE [Ponticaulis sp.]|tara:strand:- start:27076 stop:27732 length:657 start_codon:yes stop_codon:yes gene_type:complete
MDIDLWVSLILLFAAGGLTPGPAVMLILASSLRYGLFYALIAALGVCAANVIWISLAASGAGLLAQQFPTAFLIVKIAGLCFVLWLAWSTAVQPVSTHFEEDVSKVFGKNAKSPPKYGRVIAQFFRGMGLQISNPNALVWFGGLLPTFFSTDQSIMFQVFVMILTVTFTELFGLGIYATGARLLAHKFSEPGFARAFYVCAAFIMAASVLWAFASQIL